MLFRVDKWSIIRSSNQGIWTRGANRFCLLGPVSVAFPFSQELVVSQHTEVRLGTLMMFRVNKRSKEGATGSTSLTVVERAASVLGDKSLLSSKR